MNPAIIAILNAVLPAFIERIKELWAKEHPDEPPLTDPAIHAAVLTWVAGTIAKDDAFLAGG